MGTGMVNQSGPVYRALANVGRALGLGRRATAHVPEPYFVPGDGGRVRPLRQGFGDVADALLAQAWPTGLQLGSRYNDYQLAAAYAACLTAWACVQVRCGLVADIPLKVVAETGETLEASPAMSFLKNQTRLLWYIQASLMIWGVAYLRKRPNVYGYPTQVEWLSPLDVTPLYDAYHDTVTGYRVERRQELVKPSGMIAIRTFNPLSDVDGMSPYEVAWWRNEAERNLITWAAAFFRNSARPDGMLTFEGSISDQQLKEHRTLWEQFKGAKNAWKTYVAGSAQGGRWNWQPVTPAPKDLAMSDLAKQARTDICAVMKVHPTLIGIGDASDPLSASNTYDAVWRNHIQHVAIPDAKFICAGLNEQWLHADFDDLGFLVTLEPDTAKVMGSVLSSPERLTSAVSGSGAPVLTTNEAREYIGLPPLEGIIERDPARILSAWTGGLITLNEGRKALGYGPLPTGNVFNVPGAGILVQPDKLGDMQPKPSYAPFGSPGLEPWQAAALDQGKVPAPEAPALPASTPAAEVTPVAPHSADSPPVQRAAPNPAYLSLSLSEFSAGRVAAIRDQLGAVLPVGTPVQWESPFNYHVTLLYALDVDDATLTAIRENLPREWPMPDLHVERLGVFDTPDGLAVHLVIEPNALLLSLQKFIYGLFADRGVPVSAHHLPAAYTPHVTLCYLPAGSVVPPLDVDDVLLLPDSLQVGRADYQMIESIPFVRANDEARIDAQLRELGLWRDKVRKRGHEVAFQAEHLPGELVDYVRGELDGLWNPSAVFEAARAWVRTGERAAPLGASEEEALDYWREFDALTVDLGRAWLDYQQVDDALIDLITTAPEEGIAALNDALDRQALEAAWIGTPEQPGPLLALILAGNAAGKQSIDRETAARPTSTRAQAIRATSDAAWELVFEQALEYARKYVGKLIKGLDETTIELIRRAVAEQIEKGLTQSELRDLVARILTPKGQQPDENVRVRARIIADTESATAFNQGAVERFKAADIEYMKFRTVRDADVCPICRPLYDVRAKVGEGWDTPKGKKAPPLHPQCRCFIRAVVEW